MESDGQRARRRMKAVIEEDPKRRKEARERAEIDDHEWFLELVGEVVEEAAYHLPSEGLEALATEVQLWFSNVSNGIEIPDIEIPDVNIDL